MSGWARYNALCRNGEARRSASCELFHMIRICAIVNSSSPRQRITKGFDPRPRKLLAMFDAIRQVRFSQGTPVIPSPFAPSSSPPPA